METTVPTSGSHGPAQLIHLSGILEELTRECLDCVTRLVFIGSNKHCNEKYRRALNI